MSVINRAEMGLFVAQIAVRNSAAGRRLTDTMRIQPELDPYAGYGAFQCPRMLLETGLDDDDLIRFINKFETEYHLYVFLRGTSYIFTSQEQVERFHANIVKISWKIIMDACVEFCPSFNSTLAQSYIKC